MANVETICRLYRDECKLLGKEDVRNLISGERDYYNRMIASSFKEVMTYLLTHNKDNKFFKDSSPLLSSNVSNKENALTDLWKTYIKSMYKRLGLDSSIFGNVPSIRIPSEVTKAVVPKSNVAKGTKKGTKSTVSAVSEVKKSIPIMSYNEYVDFDDALYMIESFMNGTAPSRNIPMPKNLLKGTKGKAEPIEITASNIKKVVNSVKSRSEPMSHYMPLVINIRNKHYFVAVVERDDNNEYSLITATLDNWVIDSDELEKEEDPTKIAYSRVLNTVNMQLGLDYDVNVAAYFARWLETFDFRDNEEDGAASSIDGEIHDHNEYDNKVVDEERDDMAFMDNHNLHTAGEGDEDNDDEEGEDGDPVDLSDEDMQ
ncbi:hypothetical protein HDU85_005933 [Gaertneriomyces sp. JEL0708]|nr:hypothetical protein HDU85_005933 [Gaertneriomyces sp. JEL0708]